MKNRLIIMRGIPGSGKSHKANELAGENGIVLSTDDFFINDEGEYVFDFKTIGRAHEWNKDRARNSMGHGIPVVVIDNTNTTTREWKPYAQMAAQYNYDVEFAYPDSPWWNEIEPRMRNNNFTDEDVEVFVKKNNHGVPAETIRRMMERFNFETN